MVSRTTRTASQPRSTRSSSNGRQMHSFDAWENVNDNIRPNHRHPNPGMMDRRAKSSMRHQSNGRAGPVPVAVKGARHGPPSRIPAGTQMAAGAHRPRAVSAGRIRPSHSMPMHQGGMPGVEDPNDVTRQILNLRERRETSSRKKVNASPMRGRPMPGAAAAGTHMQRPRAGSPQGRVLRQAGSNMSKEEIVAEERLARAENKISGLLDDLEELKFFQELEGETPSASTPKTPSQKSGNSRNNGPSTPRTPSQQQAPHTPRDRPVSRGRENPRTAGIPLNIRTVSPARGGRLPPPPPAGGTATTPRGLPAPAAGKAAASLQAYKPLSPRAIAKLDRNSLELECQTLVRKMQIIEQERNSQTAMIEMYEISLQDHDSDKLKVAKLQGELGKVSGELKRQLQNIAKGKETLVKDYEEKLQNNLSKLHRVQEKADSYKMELEITREEASRAKEQLDAYQAKLSDEKNKAEDSKSREGMLEMQLAEARDLNASLVKKVEKKRTELTNLQNEFSQTAQQLRDEQMERDDQHQTQIASLEEQVRESQDRCQRIEQDFKDRDEQAADYEKKLDMAQIKESEDEALIEELQVRVEELEKETVAKYEEGKKAIKTQETRKMQELVAERANQTREYERRIKAMQEQLRRQADRYHSDIQETRRRNDERLEAMRDEIREELRLQEGAKIAKLETELSVLRRNYEEAKDDFSSRLKESQQKSRDAAADFQRQDEVRQQELDHMHERLESYVKELNEKEKELSDLGRRLEESRKGLEAMEVAKTQSVAELLKRDDQLQLERENFANRESEFKAQMEALKAGFDELEDRLRTENEDLQKQMDDAIKRLSEAQTAAKENADAQTTLVEVQAALDETKANLQAERTRSEEAESELRVELAKMEGKLRASESSLKLKKTLVQELETQVDIATAAASKVGEEKESEILSLQNQLEEVTKKLDDERTSVQEKRSELTKSREQIATLEEKLNEMNKLDEMVRDLKQKAAQIQYDKAELEAQNSKKEKLVERYNKSIQDLEVKLEKERENHSATESSLADLKRTVESLERDKARRETELTSLRKDYEDLSTLLEENLHSSAKKDELDKQLQRREREMRETVDIYNQNVEELEDKLKSTEKSKFDLEKRIKTLQTNLDDSKDEKMKLRSELSNLQQRYDNTKFDFDSYREQHEESKGGIEAEMGRKDRHMRETVQRYTRTIADLETKLEEESQVKNELEDRLSSARSELEDKQEQTQELIQKHTKAILKLESDLSNATFDKEQLQTRLDQTNRDLEQKRKELMNSMSKYSTEFSELQNVKLEHDEYRQKPDSNQEELARKTQQVDEMKRKIPELLADLQSKSRECDDNEAEVRRLEAELKRRKDQYNETVSRYTDQIASLESQLDDHSVARSSTQDRAESVKAESFRKEQKIRDLQSSIKELEAKLEIAVKNKEAAKQKVDSISRELDEKDSSARMFEMEKIELETKLQTQSRAKDELRSKVSDLSSRLERKEREVREVTDRYKMYVLELESKLDQDSDAKHQLQREIDRLKNNLSSATEASNEASELREKVYSLEKAVDNYRGKARDAEFKSKDSVRSLEDKLSDAEKAREEVEVALQKVQGEKAEVIAALEGVINEVQNREDEIESLSDLLHRRDEELQHAKIIATKALQSAKDMQKRYKDKDKSLQSDLMERMDELSDNVDTLSSKNETLQRKISMLERDLRDKNLECKRLKDQLRQIDGNQLARDARDPVKDDASAFTSSTFGSSTRVDSFANPASTGSHSGRGSRGLKIRTAGSVDPEGLGMGTDSFSPGSQSPRSQHDMFDKEVEFASFHDKDPGDGVYEDDGGGSSTIVTSDVTDRWSQDFETESGFDSVSSEPLSSKSRRSIERDALRKYVRQRYMAKR